MREYSTSPIELLNSVWRNRELILVSAKREVIGRYKGSVLGLFWSFFNPLLMLLVYTFVFGEVFNARWHTGGDSKSSFALVLFAGLIVFNLFAECVNSAPGLILSNPNFVKKVVYPLEILPMISIISSLYHSGVSLLIWLIAYLAVYGIPHLTVLYLPLIVVPFAIFIIGLCWSLAALGVYLRDVAQITGMLTTVLMFLSPIFYPASALSESYRKFLYLNPLTPVIEQVREILIWNHTPDLSVLVIGWLVALLVGWLGFACFQMTRKGFADVI